MSKATAASLSIDVKHLRGALKDVTGVVEARNTIPILSHVLLTVADRKLTITGTDLDLMVQRVTDVDGQSLSIAVEAALLDRIAGKLPADVVAKLVLDDKRIVLTAGRARFVLPTLPPDDMPILMAASWDAEFEVDAIVLGAALGKVTHAISTEETRYYLNGIFWHVSGEVLRFAATDGHRLARTEIELPDGAAPMGDVIMPRKAVRQLSGLLDRYEGKVGVSVTASKMRFEIGETSLTFKTIDGTFPDYSRVIPESNPLLLKVDRATLAEAVGRVAVVSTEKTRAVKVELDRDRLVLSVSSPEHGQGVEEVPCSYSGAPLTIGLNSKFLLDTLSQLSMDEIEARFADSAAPTRWEDREGGSSVFVVMPMRV